MLGHLFDLNQIEVFKGPQSSIFGSNAIGGLISLRSNNPSNKSILNAAAKEYGIDAKKDMWRLPAMFVGQYAERDAESTLKLWKRLETELYQEELWDIFNLETKLFPCLVDMRFKGVRVDLEKADNIKKSLIHKEKKILAKIKALTGVDVEIMAARSIAKAFDKLKLPYDRTEKSKEPSFTKNFLQNHPSLFD